MSVVELECVSKSCESKIAVSDLSLRIEAGTMFGLLGPNGAGKTSTIRMMIGHLWGCASRIARLPDQHPDVWQARHAA